MKRLLATTFTIALGLSLSAGALAHTHIARIGETLEQLALRYYDNPDLEIVIRAANGFVHPDDGRLTQGERIEIPEVIYHRLRRGESWATLADQYLGSPRRARFLAELNDQKEEHVPAEGTIIKVPYQVLHILASDEKLRSVARMYYGKKRSSSWLKKYNLTRKRRFSRGNAVLVPLIDVEFTEAERKKIDKARSERYTNKDKKKQIKATGGIKTLKQQFGSGHYVEMVATGQLLLVKGGLTDAQKVGVHQFLAFAYVALGSKRLAMESFHAALKYRPDMDLSPLTTSPKILAVFRQARETAPQMTESTDQ